MLDCSGLSDSGEDAKVKGTRKVGGERKKRREKGRRKESRFLNSADPTISESGTVHVYPKYRRFCQSNPPGELAKTFQDSIHRFKSWDLTITRSNSKTFIVVA